MPGVVSSSQGHRPVTLMPGALILSYGTFTSPHSRAIVGRPETTRNHAFRPPARAPTYVRTSRAPGAARGDGDTMGRDTEDAASRLHLLATHYREHPQTGPSERRSPSVTPGAPLNLGIVDYMSRCVDEVVQHARDEAAGDIGP